MNKKNNGLIIFLILLLIGLVTLVTLLLTGIVKSPFIKETKVEKVETKEEKNEEVVKDELQLIKVKKDDLSKTDTNEIGTVKLGGTDYKVTMKFDEEVNGTELWNIYVGDTKLEINNMDYVAVLDNNFLVVKKYESQAKNNYALRIYDKDLKNVYNNIHIYRNVFDVIDKYGHVDDDFDVTVSNHLEDNIIDNHHMIVAECNEPINQSNHNQDFVQKLLTFENGKFSEQEILHIENVFCSSQR